MTQPSLDKRITKKLLEFGFSWEKTILVRAFLCEELQSAYLQGYKNGYNEEKERVVLDEHRR